MVGWTVNWTSEWLAEEMTAGWRNDQWREMAGWRNKRITRRIVDVCVDGWVKK